MNQLFVAALAILLGLSSTTAKQSIQDSKWELLEVGPWASREGVMGVEFNNYVYLSGGRQDTSFFNDIYRIDSTCTVGDCQWQLITNNAPWSARGYHIMFSHNGYMYIIGGQNYTAFYNDIWRSSDGTTWSQILPNKYIPKDDNTTNYSQFEQRAGLAAISYNDKIIYVMGGCQNNPPDRILFNDVWYSMDDGATWIQLIYKSSWRPRSGARIQIYNDVLYLAAGEFGFSSPTQFDDIWKLDISDSSNTDWELVTDNPGWDKRSGHGFSINLNDGSDSGVFYIIAGYYDKHDLWLSYDSGATWNLTRNDVFNCSSATDGSDHKCGRYDFWSLIDSENNLILFGGDGDYSTFGGEYNETWRLYLGD